MNNKNFDNKLDEIVAFFENRGAKSNFNNYYSDGCGPVLLLFYYYLYKRDNDILDKALELLGELSEQYNNMPVTNAAWYAKYIYMLKRIESLEIIELDLFDDDSWKFLDDLFHEKMTEELRAGRFDVMHHGLSMAQYFLMRNDSKALEEAVDLVGELSIKDANGIKWESAMNKEDKLTFNLGLSHGMPSIVAILSKIYEKGVAREKCKHLIEGAVNYILHQKLPEGKYNSLFGTCSLEDFEANSRLAWCYGDLGIAISIYHAAKALGREDYMDEVKKIMLHASKRRGLDKNGVVDACICHGTAGIAHIFKRMHKYLGMPECLDAADYWMQKTLDMSVCEDGYAGYKNWEGPDEGYRAETGILEGVSGVGLALLYYVSDIEPSWDELLLIS